jgi:7-cyano-7-deazaguanine synthase
LFFCVAALELAAPPAILTAAKKSTMPPDSLPKIALLYSGGLDSAVLLAHLLGQGHAVQPLYIRCSLVWEDGELAAARRFLAAVKTPTVENLIVLNQPVGDLYGEHWSTNGHGVPDAASADDAVYLPGRNAILLVKAAVWCRLHGIEHLALAVLATNPFPDATSAFFEQFEAALGRATGGPIHFLRPFGNLSKAEVMQLGRHLPLELTFSCIAPVDGKHCGKCNKCSERAEAIRGLRS